MDVDHLVLGVSDLEASTRHYEAVFRVLGFEKRRQGVWANAQGIFVEIRQARSPHEAYRRHGVGLNHLGVKARSREEVDAAISSLRAAGVAAPEPQSIDGAYVVFVPDRDGLRIEIGYDP